MLGLPTGSHTPPPALGLRSFERLYHEHFRFVWSAVRGQGVPAADIEDVVQEVFLVVVRRIGEFEGRSSERTWIYGIVRRVAYRFHRTRTRRARRRSALSAQPAPHAGESDVAARYCTGKLDEFLDELGPPQREVFVLAELEQMQGSEIARTLGVNQNTVYARLRTARKHFAQRFASDDGDRLLAASASGGDALSGARKRVARAVAPLGLAFPKAAAVPLVTWFKIKAAAIVVAAAGTAAVVVAPPAEPPAQARPVLAAASTAATRAAHDDVRAARPAAPDLMPPAAPPVLDAPSENVVVEPESPPAIKPARTRGQRRRSGAHARRPAAPKAAAPVEPEATPAAPAPAATPASTSGIVREVAGLKAARRALRDGKHRKALALLDAQSGEFGRGRLEADRVASSVEAYCGLGRTADARKQARRLAALAPNNHALADRVRRGCAASALDDVAARSF